MGDGASSKNQSIKSPAKFAERGGKAGAGDRPNDDPKAKRPRLQDADRPDAGARSTTTSNATASWHGTSATAPVGTNNASEKPVDKKTLDKGSQRAPIGAR